LRFKTTFPVVFSALGVANFTNEISLLVAASVCWVYVEGQSFNSPDAIIPAA